ncbi:MAG: phosphate ABC transporter ATP-binding protein [bacterium]|nr:phosphate ABC transporter ATP-binding protein [bacterium]
MSAPAAIAIGGLALRRGGRRVLDRVDLEVAPGTVAAVAGPSGGGKSSILRCVNRLLEPPAGTVHVDGRDVTAGDPVELRRRVGMVFQQPVALPGTVAENVRFGPAQVDRLLTDTQLAELLELSGLEPALADRPADELSGGQVQRVALARCLANEPSVLLLDEPTSALDPAARNAVEEALGRIVAERGVTALLVTHDLEQARRVAQRLYLLAGGKVVESGAPAAMLDGEDHPLTAAFARGELTGEAP